MKIQLNKPKYVIPAIILPFLLIFFYVYKDSIGSDKVVKQGNDSLQVGLADVSNQVKANPIGSKLDAYRRQFKEADGYTAVGELHAEQTKNQASESLYNDKEKRMLDSIDKSVSEKYGFDNSKQKIIRPGSFPDASVPVKSNYSREQDKALAAALAKINSPVAQIREPKQTESAQPDPMRLFRQQMALADSMSKANDPDYKAEQLRKQKADLLESELKNKKKLAVYKSTSSNSTFNTITADQDETFISAIVDQDITGYSGSRLRIRLLDDMMAGKFLIKKGTYLYAQISGFSGQRVNLTVSSIMVKNNLLPVQLLIYDNDGLPGLYVPASAFREFTKELGGQGSQGLTLQQQAETNNQLVMSMVQQMFQSTTTAVSKLIRKNKAKLKYNTLVYLIDPDEIKNTQNKY